MALRSQLALIFFVGILLITTTTALRSSDLIRFPSTTTASHHALSTDPSLTDFLEEHGLPRGLFPDNVVSYLFKDGYLNVTLSEECNITLDDPQLGQLDVIYKPEVTAKVQYGSLSDIEGISLFNLTISYQAVQVVWVDSPICNYIYFKIYNHPDLKLNVTPFLNVRNCKPLPDFLEEHGLPRGLFPDNVVSYDFKDGYLNVTLSEECIITLVDPQLGQLDVIYKPEVTAKLQYGSLSDIEGISLFNLTISYQAVHVVWVDSPISNYIYFRIYNPPALKLNVTPFLNVPSCNPTLAVVV